jgi:glutamine amidotransferase-like uncharacterized protein
MMSQRSGAMKRFSTVVSTQLSTILVGAFVSACAAAPDTISSADDELQRAPGAADVYVYDGPNGGKGRDDASCHDCAETALKLARRLGYRAEYIRANQITEKQLSQARLFLWPGGQDDTDRDFDQFVAAGRAKGIDNVGALKKWVAGGGRYLGVCAGAYLAAFDSAGNKTLDILGGTVADDERPLPNGDPDDIGHPILVSVRGATSALDAPHVVDHQAGPYFSPPAANAQEVWARYSATNRIAAMVTANGKGTVGVIGPHFEATTDWYVDGCTSIDPKYTCESKRSAVESLASRERANHAFFGAFVERLIGKPKR